MPKQMIIYTKNPKAAVSIAAEYRANGIAARIIGTKGMRLIRSEFQPVDMVGMTEKNPALEAFYRTEAEIRKLPPPQFVHLFQTEEKVEKPPQPPVIDEPAQIDAPAPETPESEKTEPAKPARRRRPPKAEKTDAE